VIHGHGGNIDAAARRLGCRPEAIVDMSSNINPLGMPPGLMSHLHEQLNAAGVLPEADARRSIRRLAGMLGVDEGRMLAGGGTTQFIYTACPALQSNAVLIVGPTYADYADACRMHGIEPRFILADAGDRFAVDPDRLAASLGGIDTVFLCNPNNPTGRIIPNDALAALCRTHPRTHFVIDESYLPFASEADAVSMSAADLPNVSILWSFSKIFGVPGLRAGFLIAHASTVDGYRRFMQPWSLNSLAQAAVDFICGHPDAVNDFMRATSEFLFAEKRRFGERLGSVAGLTVFPSQASYLLIVLPEALGAERACRHMLQQRILIRNCSNFHGLSERFIRISLKSPQQNRIAADTLAALLKRYHGAEE
jgi:threonine-phosphate decarboxylase